MGLHFMRVVEWTRYLLYMLEEKCTAQNPFFHFLGHLLDFQHSKISTSSRG